MSVVIVDYGSGNLRSAAKAFERAAGESGCKTTIVVSDDAETVLRASRIVLPGVGAFADCKAGLVALPGMWEALNKVVIEAARPFLGICVGLQLMARIGHEHGDHTGFGWIDGEVDALSPDDASLKIPHMGWNDLNIRKPDHPLLAGITSGMHAYFVHSYHLRCNKPDDILADADYGGSLAAFVGRDNMAGTQFHPEKSQSLGLRLIANFLSWQP